MAPKTTANTQKPASVTSHGRPSSVRSTALLAKSATAATTSISCTEVRSNGFEFFAIAVCLSSLGGVISPR